MKSFEPRLIRRNEICHDQSGNPYVPEYIGNVEIVNVPESRRFIYPDELDEGVKKLFIDLLRDSQPHLKNPDEDIQEGEYFAASVSRGSETTAIPAQIFIGTIGSDQGKMIVTGNVHISFHDIGNTLEPKIIGFEMDGQSITKPLRYSESSIVGAVLAPKRYQEILTALQTIPKEKTIPHPGTKEFVRCGEEYKKLSEKYAAAGLAEIPGAMFKFENRREETEVKKSPWTLVAVHPYYLEYHHAFGQRDRITPEERDALMSKYDNLFSEHRGPLVVVEEQSKILETFARLQQAGVQDAMYFVVTEDRESSLFPYTENSDFIDLLRELGVDNLKFVGGHDAGDTPYVSHDPLSGVTHTYSGCLRGLANRIEKRGFPKVETMPGYTYS